MQSVAGGFVPGAGAMGQGSGAWETGLPADITGDWSRRTVTTQQPAGSASSRSQGSKKHA